MFAQRLFLNKLYSSQNTVLSWQRMLNHVLHFININIPCSYLALTMIFMPVHGVSYNSTSGPGRPDFNLSELTDNLTKVQPNSPTTIPNSSVVVSTKGNSVVVERTLSDGSDVPRDSPTALIIASSIAAVSILVFFVIAYLWHTHQLDSRARKLAIRLAADSERSMNCRNCELQVSRGFSRPTPTTTTQRANSESSQEQNEYVSITPDPELGRGSDCGRSSSGIPESEAGDNEDVFEPTQLPPINDRGRVGIRGGRGAHRKWSRSRKTPSVANLDKRDSAVTDKEILTHFASRRHSTFFI